MFGGREPVYDGDLEFLGGHAGVCSHHNLENRRFAPRQGILHVAFEQRGERFLVFPFRMLRRECLDSVERKGELKIHRLLSPKAAVVVECGNPLGDRYPVR